MKTTNDKFENDFDQSIHDPIYEGASITVAESLTCILTLMTSFDISGALLAAFLGVIEYHCKKPNKFPKTLYRLKKFFKNLKTPLTRHFFCSKYFSKVERKDSVCPQCNDSENITYFIEIDIIHQLKALFKRPNFYKSVSTYRFNRKKINENNFEDIYDGSIYKNLVEEGFLADKSNISFTWNTVGVPLFRSSKFSI